MSIQDKLTIAHIVKTVKNLPKEDIFYALKQAGFDVKDENSPLTKEQQAAILQFIRNKKQTKLSKPTILETSKKCRGQKNFFSDG